MATDPENAGTVIGEGEYQKDEPVTATANAEPGWKFVNWTDEADVEVSTDQTYTFVMPDENLSLTANFETCVTDADQLQAALNNPNVSVVNFCSDITGDVEANIEGQIIDGHGYTLTGSLTKNAANVTTQNLDIESSSPGGDLIIDGANAKLYNVSVAGTVTGDGSIAEYENLTIFDGVLNVDKVNWYDTIQGAIDAAAAGEILLVGSGTYQEQIIINKDLTLTGVDNPTIKAPATPEIYSMEETGDRTWEPVIFAYGGNLDGNKAEGDEKISVEISGLIVDGDARAPVANRSAAILIRNVNSSSISDNKLQNMALGGAETFGLMVYGDSALEVSGNTVNDFQRGGIGINGNLDGTGPYANIRGNTVTAPPASTGWAANGIQIGWGASGTITNNTAKSSAVISDDWAAAGILIPGSSDVEIIGNTVYANDIGIGIAGYKHYLGHRQLSSGTKISDNTIYNNTYSVHLSGDLVDTKIEENKIYDSYVGIISFDNIDSHWSGGGIPINTVVEDNKIYDNDFGLYVYEIYDDNRPDPGELPPGFVVAATHNWWGFDSGPQAVANPDGSGNSVGVDESVDFIPWWADEAMTIEGYPPTGIDGTLDFGLSSVQSELPNREDLPDLEPYR